MHSACVDGGDTEAWSRVGGTQMRRVAACYYRESETLRCVVLGSRELNNAGVEMRRAVIMKPKTEGERGK